MLNYYYLNSINLIVKDYYKRYYNKKEEYFEHFVHLINFAFASVDYYFEAILIDTVVNKNFEDYKVEDYLG